MRIRYLKPDFFKDEDIAELDLWVRLLFQGLWVLADKAGRLRDIPKRIKAEIFPYEKFDIEKGLQILAKKKQFGKEPFIVRYEVEGIRYIQILKWKKHQRPHHTEKPSEIPEFKDEMLKDGDITDKEPLKDGCITGRNGEGNGNGKGKEKGGSGGKAPPPPENSKDEKKPYGEFKNIRLTDREYQQMAEKMGPKNRADLIIEGDQAIERDLRGKPKKTKLRDADHYLMLLSWYRKGVKKGEIEPWDPAAEKRRAEHEKAIKAEMEKPLDLSDPKVQVAIKKGEALLKEKGIEGIFDKAKKRGNGGVKKARPLTAGEIKPFLEDGVPEKHLETMMRNRGMTEADIKKTIEEARG